MTKVTFQRGNQEFIDNLSILDGQLVYNIDNGMIYQDVGEKRVELGKKSVLYIPQILTPEQKSQVLTNIGAQEKEGKWETVEEFTADDSIVKRTTYPDGTPYKFKAVRITIVGVQKKRCVWFARNDSLLSQAAMDSAHKVNTITFFDNYGFIKSVVEAGDNEYESVVKSTSGPKFNLPYDYITEISTSAVVEKGLTIKIEAVRI